MYGGMAAPIITDEEIIEHYVFEIVRKGCRECEENREGLFFYEAGVQEENGLKWYMSKIYCKTCDIHYDELFEVRGKLNESNRNSEETQE
jgi:hypothetical protein